MSAPRRLATNLLREAEGSGSGPDTPQAVSTPVSGSAVRMRALRRRRETGLRIFQVETADDVLDGMVAEGLISVSDVEARTATARAKIGAAISAWLEHHFGPQNLT